MGLTTCRFMFMIQCVVCIMIYVCIDQSSVVDLSVLFEWKNGPIISETFFPAGLSAGGLKMRDWKTPNGQKCTVGKRSTKLQDW